MRLLSFLSPLWLWLYARYRGYMASILRLGPIPTHVGFIMDGNRRFADKIRTDRSSGHRHGFTKLLDILEWCLELGVSNVSVFAFGVDNFKRDPQEVADLMRLAEEKLWQLLEEKEIVAKHRINIQVLGELHLLPPAVERAARQVMKATQHYDGVTLNICLAYSSRLEMAQARQAAALHKAATSGQRSAAFQQQLYTKGQPPVDLLIRTSGETRLSDFLLWQCATAELVFSKALWPEFSYLHLLQALVHYQRATPALTAIRAEWGRWTGSAPPEKAATPQRENSISSWGVASSRGLDSEAGDGSSDDESAEGDDDISSSASEPEIRAGLVDTPFASAAGGNDMADAAAGGSAEAASSGSEAMGDRQEEAGRGSAESAHRLREAGDHTTDDAALPETPRNGSSKNESQSEHHRVPSISDSISAAPSAALVRDSKARSADSIFAGNFTAAAFDRANAQSDSVIGADSAATPSSTGDDSAVHESGINDSASQLPDADSAAQGSASSGAASPAASGSSQRTPSSHAAAGPVATASDTAREGGQQLTGTPTNPTLDFLAGRKAAGGSDPAQTGTAEPAAAAGDSLQAEGAAEAVEKDSAAAQEDAEATAEAPLSAPRTPDRRASDSRGYPPISNTLLSPFSQHVTSPPPSSAESSHVGAASLPTSPKSALRTSASFAASESGATPKHARFQDSPTFSSRHSSKQMPLHSAHGIQRHDSMRSVQSVTHTPLRAAHSLQRQNSQSAPTLRRQGSSQSLPALQRQHSSESLSGMSRPDSEHSVQSVQSVRRSHTPLQNAVSMPIRRQGSTASLASSKAGPEAHTSGARRPSEENVGRRSYSMPRRVMHVHAPGTIQEECPCCTLERKLPRHRVHSMPMTSSMAQGPSHGLWH